MNDNSKQIPPAGYQVSHGALVIAVIFGIWTAFLTLMAVLSDADIAEVLLFIIVSATFVIGAIFSDVTTNATLVPVTVNNL